MIVILLLVGAHHCFCEDDAKAKAEEDTKAKLWAAWIEELERSPMRVFHATSGATALSILEPNLELRENATRPALLNVFIESDSAPASSESIPALLKLLKSGKPQPVPLIETDGAFAIKNKTNEVAFHVEYFNEVDYLGHAGVMVWKASYAGTIQCKGVKSPIELYQTCPGLDFMAVPVSQKQLDTFIRLTKSPAKQAK